MHSKSFCSIWGANSSASALGVFLGTTKPPIRVLASLHGTCRDVRRNFTDTALLQTPPLDSLITSSQKTPRLASISAGKDAQTKLLRAINMSQLDLAAEELKRLQTSGLAVEPYTVEQLIEGALARSAFVPTKLCHTEYCESTPVAVCNCSLAEEAEVPVCHSCVQFLATVCPSALPLLHLPVLGHGSHQGGMVSLSTTVSSISESTLCTAAVLLSTMSRTKLLLVPTRFSCDLWEAVCLPAGNSYFSSASLVCALGHTLPAGLSAIPFTS